MLRESGSHCSAVDVHLLEDMDASALNDDVGHRELCMNVRHVVNGLHSGSVLLLVVFTGERGECHRRVAPNAVAALQPGSHVVVSRCAPKVGTQRSAFTKKVVAKNVVLAQQTSEFVELDAKVGVRDGDV